MCQCKRTRGREREIEIEYESECVIERERGDRQGNSDIVIEREIERD